MSEPQRGYGSDSNDEFDVLVEATERPDGTIHYAVVVIDKRSTPVAGVEG